MIRILKIKSLKPFKFKNFKGVQLNLYDCQSRKNDKIVYKC